MARIRQDDVEAVRERTDLVRLVQQYVGLKKAGRSYTGLCPFHTEKTASLSVDPAKQVFYCFGCGKGGNAFHFLQEIESLTFPEAVERLAGQAGITLRYEGGSAGDRSASARRQALHRANQRAGDLYHRMLLEGREAEGARAYLQGRGISLESVQGFGIGFSPGYQDFLLRRMAREFSTEVLIEAGLAQKDARGGVRDRFRSRVTFPIHDVTGRAVGFGARLLEGEGPKYLNTAETRVYKKGELLYNLHRAKADLARTGRAFVVEGYTDVIAVAQAGVPTAVATCGTALSEGHFRLLSRFCRRAVLCFDADEAGARAAERASGLFEAFGLEVSVLILPQGQDPADFVTSEGGPAFEALTAEPLIEYLLRRAIRDADLSTPEGKARAVRDGLPVVRGLRDPVLRSEYAGRLADLVGASPTDVRMELEAGGGNGGPAPGRPGVAPPARAAPAQGGARSDTAQGGPEAEVRSPSREIEKEALKMLAQHPDISRGYAGHLGEDHFETQRYRRALDLLRGEWTTPAQLADRASDQGLAPLLAEVTLEPVKGEPSPEYAERVFSRLEERALKRRMDTMRKRLERLNPVTDADAFDPLFRELTDVTGRWREAKARAGEGA